MSDGREFDGFCTPCGGFRKHKLGCPDRDPLLENVLPVHDHGQMTWISKDEVLKLWGVPPQPPSGP